MTRLPNRSAQTLRLLAELLGSPRGWRHEGLLTSKWEESDCPGVPLRHVYRLTPDGLAYARDQAEGEPATLGARMSKANS